MKRRNYIVAYPKDKYFPYGQMFSGLNKIKNNIGFIQFYPNTSHRWKIERMLKILSFTPGLHKFFNEKIIRIHEKILFNKICRKFQAMDFQPDEFVLVINQGFLMGTLNMLKKKFSNLKIVYYFTDQIDKCEIRTDIWKHPNKYYADLIISYDEDDANKHDVLYYRNSYSEILDKEIIYLSNKTKYDVCFIGAMKDRHDNIIQNYRYLKSLGLNVFFYVTYENGRKINRQRGIIYSKRSLKYKKYLKIFAKSSCILDIVKGDSNAMTTRIAEAVMLKKKIISNNEKVKDLPFYDKNKIYVYNGFLDIDKKFFIKNSDVLYNKKAKNYFDPHKFIEFIGKHLY